MHDTPNRVLIKCLFLRDGTTSADQETWGGPHLYVCGQQYPWGVWSSREFQIAIQHGLKTGASKEPTDHLPKSLYAHENWQTSTGDLVGWNPRPGCFLTANVEGAGWVAVYGQFLSFAFLLGYDAVCPFGIITLGGQNPLAGLWVLEKYGCKMHEVYSDGTCHAGQMVAFTMLIGKECLRSQPQMGREATPALSHPPSPTRIMAAR